MGPLVADASAIVDYLSSGREPTPYDEALTSGVELHVPEVCDVEVVSALRRSVLRGVMPPADVPVLLIDYAELPIHRHEHLSLLGRAFDLRENFSASDAMYVALAERLDASLLSADRRLVRAVRTHTSVSTLP